MNLTLWATVLGTLGAGVGSVLLAALLSRALLGRFTQHLLSLAAGALLATAFMHLLPEAFESDITPHVLFTTLLLGLVFFFLLDKAELWHHGHEHSHDHDHGSHSMGQMRRPLSKVLQAVGRSWPVTACTLLAMASWWLLRS
jgi:zinc and cadmium transporter